MHVVRVGDLRCLCLLMAVAVAVAGCGIHCQHSAARQGNPRVLFQTDLGDITIEVYEKQAPVTAANFLRYVDKHRFKGASFYRTVRPDNQPNNAIKIEVIQGGLKDDEGHHGLQPIEHGRQVRDLCMDDSQIGLQPLELVTAAARFRADVVDPDAVRFVLQLDAVIAQQEEVPAVVRRHAIDEPDRR